MEICDSKLYRGELGQQGSNDWKNTDRVWIVNGHIEKSDGNYFKHYNVSEITLNNIKRTSNKAHKHGKLFIGPYP